MTAARSPKPRKSDELPAPSTLTYEQAIAEAEGIVDRIESGEAGLDRSIAEYERGMLLLKRCREFLQRAEQRVQDLTEQMQADSPRGPRREGGAEGSERAH